jgi:hypothetical protein
MERPPALNPLDAHSTIERILGVLGADAISFTAHARSRSRQRNFSRRDVEKVLASGVVSPNAEWNEQHGSWKYQVSGRDLDGDELTVIVTIEPEFQRITVVTGT